MKYIRTKDGRIISYDENANKIDLPMILNYPNQILKQSNTIKELCDAFVFEMGAEHTICKLTFEQVRDNIFNCELEDMSRLYGAIWVDGKGLIYVAKMNKTGDLVLI